MTTESSLNIDVAEEHNQPFSEEIESYLTSLQESPKPWFLSSTMIYQWVRSAVASVPLGNTIVEQSIRGIATLTVFINEKTKSNVVVLDMEKMNDLITKLDGILSDQFIRMDDGLDSMRSKLGNSLRQLIASLIQNKKLALAFLEKKGDNLREVGETASKSVKSRYEQAMEVLTSVLNYAKNNYPKYYTQVETNAECARAISMGYYDRILEASTILLKNAQPYVHNAVERATPYVVNAVEITQPYVVQARPYLDPVVAKAQNVNNALQCHKVVGPYVTHAEKLLLDTCKLALEETKTYCLLPVEPAIEVNPASEAN